VYSASTRTPHVSSAARARLRAVLARLDQDNLLVTVAALYVIGLLAALSAEIHQDGWLSLVAGRAIAHGGLPSTDTLTTYTLGTDWVDQQWLAHLAFYGASTLGGVKAALLVHALLVTTTLLLALAAARRRGGTTRSVVWIALPAMLSLTLTSWQMRAQSFAYVLFVLVLWLLIADARMPSRRVFWVVLPLVLWANLHGSVVLGVGLVGLRGLLAILERSSHGRARGAALMLAAAACLFASPYGLSVLGYYGRTLFNPLFAHVVSEWAPTTPGALAAPFYLLVFVALWTIARHGRNLTAFERLALLATGVSGMLALRNVVWFTLLAVIVVPAALAPGMAPDRVEVPRFGRVLGRVAVVGTVAAVIVTVARSAAWFESGYPSGPGTAVAAAASRDPSARIYADVGYGDWLMWRYPSLAGRVAFDARFELLSKRQFADVYRFSNQIGDQWRAAAAGYRILVLDRRRESSLPGGQPTYKALSAGGAARIVYLDADTAVLVRR
jgi:hypothetical protein